jgi:PIN domain nuclease of toxin-antitoxin system
MAGSLLLDTCAVIWITEDEPIAADAAAVMNDAHANDWGVYVSPITAWEVGLLASRGRLRSPITPRRWFQLLLDVPTVRLADMSTDILIASSFLPGSPPRDPADRIIVATAREFGFRLVTRDRVLLDYAAEGHVDALAC